MSLPPSAGPSGPPASTDDGSLASPLGRAATIMLAVLLLLWGVELINAATGRELSLAGGIWPREPDSLIDIATSPFLHGNLEHLAGNAMALFSLGLIAALAGLKRFTLVTLTIIVLGGFGIWLFSPADHLTVGASGVVFGYFGYLLVRGLIDRRPVDLVVSAGVALAYGYVMWTSVGFGVTGISWQGHVSGFVGGLVAALVFRDRRRRPAPEPSTLPPSLSG